MSGSPWTLLGIGPTADEGAIRRAYARALKAIDVDRDPGAFIALREALASARVHATRAPAPEPVPAGGGPEPEPVPQPAPAAVSAAEPEPDVRPGWVEDVEAIQALIFGEQPREAIFAEVGTRAERLLNGPEMEQIDHAARVEQWAMDVILSGIPRSNALLVPALRRFGWLQRYQKWDCHPAIRAVVDRYGDCQLVNDLSDDKGAYAMPFKLIRRGARPRGSQATLVAQFIAEMQRDHPTVLRELPPESLEAWWVLIERRNNALPARFHRARRAWWAKFSRFAARYRLHYAWIGLKWLLIALLIVAAIAGTHGIALIFLLGQFFRTRK